MKINDKNQTEDHQSPTINYELLTKPHVSREQIFEILKESKLKPINLDYYKKALLHTSVNKYVDKRPNNIKLQIPLYMYQSLERLEFLGDAVLNLVVTNIIYSKYPTKDEGFMTRLRTKIVRSSNCVYLARKINLDKLILTGNHITSPLDATIHISESVIEDAFEAFIGAIYKDLNYFAAEVFVTGLIDKYVDFDKLTSVDDNYKDILMRYTQTYGYELPIYTTTTTSSGSGSNNENSAKTERIFEITIFLKKKTNNTEPIAYGVGRGSTKKEAEQNAAKNSICSEKDKLTCKVCVDCNKIHMDEMKSIINRVTTFG